MTGLVVGAFAADETSLQFVRSRIIGNLAAGGSVSMGASGGAGVGGGLYNQPTSFVFVDAATLGDRQLGNDQLQPSFRPLSTDMSRHASPQRPPGGRRLLTLSANTRDILVQELGRHEPIVMGATRPA